MNLSPEKLPPVRGQLLFAENLAPFTWFRVGGPAEVLFLPKDEDDLSEFLKALDPHVPVTVLGAASNVIIRDGGVAGVVIRLGSVFAKITSDGLRVTAGAAALDMRVSLAAANAGIAGLEFFSGVPGTIGGALRMNAGCYGRETRDVLLEARAVNRKGERVRLLNADFGFSYRHTEASEDLIFVEAVFQGTSDTPEAIHQRIAALKVRRETAQPIREKTGGSTFANPDPPGTVNQRSAWKLIDAAGMRGAKRGDAEVSQLHCNFLINKGHATAADIEGLGEDVRAAVRKQSGVNLRWEIRRIGRPGRGDQL